MHHTTDVFVIGAGPAGLTAAYLLTKHNRSVSIIESDPIYIGGISRTVNYKGFLFDIGGHRFFSKSAEVTALWREILPDDFIERPRLSRIYYCGKFYAYPLRVGEALRNLGLLVATLCVLSYLKARARPRSEVKTSHDWVADHFGERLYAMFFKTYTEKVWGMSCDEISADWAAQRIKGLDLREAVTAALRKSFRPGAQAVCKDGRPIKTLIETFDYPRLGPGMMWAAAADRIRERGGTLNMGQTLKSLSRDPEDGHYHITALDGEGQEHRYRARHVISSAPIRDLSDAIDPPLNSRPAAQSLGYRDFITVALVVDRPDLFSDNWIYIHDPAIRVGRIQNFRSWSPDIIPDPTLACLGLECFCFEGDSMWNSSDADLLALARRELAAIRLATEAQVIDGCVVRQPKAYPVYDDTYRSHVEAVRIELASRMPDLHLVGRNGMHKSNNQDHAMMTAMLAVENILAERLVHDVWNVNEDAEYHEAGESGRIQALNSLRAFPTRVG
jgi:protoporphyrinogen oxidase